MTSIPKNSLQVNPSPAPPPAPRGVAWINKLTAAERMGVVERAINNLCPGWALRGLARLVTPENGGQDRWMIREDADPRLGRIRWPEQIRAETRNLTEKQEATLNRNLALYQGWEAACIAAIRQNGNLMDATAAYIRKVLADDGRKLTMAQLYRWRKAYRRGGSEALKDGRWVKPWKAKADEPMLVEAERLWLAGPISGQVAWEMATAKAIEQGWRTWSYRKTAQYLRQQTPEADRIIRRVGKKAFTNEAEAFIERDYSTLTALELVNGDHHLCDVFVKVGERLNKKTGELEPVHARPWLTAWQDCASRKIVGHVIRAADPDTDVILLSLRRMILEYGAPESIAVDCGKDYSSYALHGSTKKQRLTNRPEMDATRINGTFATLGIKAHNVQPYHGQSKPIERFFGTMEDRFGKLWPTYFGNKPENRPECFQANLDAGKAPTLEEFIEAFDAWVSQDYNGRAHFGDSMEGKSPNQVYADRLTTIRTMEESLLDVLLQKQSKPVTVTQNGVTWNNLHYGQYEPGLKKWLGKKVTLRVDPADVSRVTVWQLNGKFICAAVVNKRLPANASAEMLKEAMAEKRRDRKAQLQYKDVRLRIHEDLPERMIRAATERNARNARNNPTEPTPPANYQPIRSPLEDQLPAVQRALAMPAMRPAAGAESLDLLALANAEFDVPQRRPAGGGFSLLTLLNDDPPADAGGGGESCP